MTKQSAVEQQTTAPGDELAKETTHDLEMNSCGKEDTAKEPRDRATKTLAGEAWRTTRWTRPGEAEPGGRSPADDPA